jgi:hypothetical protein
MPYYPPPPPTDVHYPQSAVGLQYIAYPAGPTAAGALLTASASAHVKGAYVELIASTPFACTRVKVTHTAGPGINGTTFLTDLATGSLGSETVIVANMISESPGVAVTGGCGTIDLPLSLPAGTRLAMRTQCNVTGSRTVRVALELSAAGDTPGPASYETYGANTTTTRGALVDAGATANVKGAYTELIASTSAITQVLVVIASGGANTSPSNVPFAVDIATGADGSEVVLIPDIRFVPHSNGITPRAVTLLTYIPAGTRIAVHASCGVNDATDRLLDIVLLGATAP